MGLHLTCKAMNKSKLKDNNKKFYWSKRKCQLVEEIRSGMLSISPFLKARDSKLGIQPG
jgi:hypothetical protein